MSEPDGAVAPQSPELEVWLCPVHHSLDSHGSLKPMDNCVACIRNDRDELLAIIREIIAAVEMEGASGLRFHEARNSALAALGEHAQ
jgi:hypothetical protein